MPGAAPLLLSLPHLEPPSFRYTFASWIKASARFLLFHLPAPLAPVGTRSLPFHDSPVYQLFSWLTLSVTRQTPCGDELFSWCADSCPESLPELPAAVSSARPFSWVSYHLLFPSTFLSTSAERHKTIHMCFPPSAVHRAAWPSFFFHNLFVPRGTS